MCTHTIIAMYVHSKLQTTSSIIVINVNKSLITTVFYGAGGGGKLSAGLKWAVLTLSCPR